MRSEQEMIDLVLDFARKRKCTCSSNERVALTKCEEMSFRTLISFSRKVDPIKKRVVSYFGDLMILQTPDDLNDPPRKMMDTKRT
jgi:hypothetical protein